MGGVARSRYVQSDMASGARGGGNMWLVRSCVALMLTLATALPAHAVLVDLGDLILDRDRRIMWTQSANLPGSQFLTWEEAQDWAENLVYAGFDDWRLPSALNRSGMGPCLGFDCSQSEMGHLFYVELDCAPHLPSEVGPPPAPCVGDQGPFTNIQENRYWTSTLLLDVAAWEFDFRIGFQGFEVFGGMDDLLSAWAVRSVRLP